LNGFHNYGYKEGLNDEKIIARLAFKDAIFHLDSNDLKVMEHYIKQRTTHYEYCKKEKGAILACGGRFRSCAKDH